MESKNASVDHPDGAVNLEPAKKILDELSREIETDGGGTSFDGLLIPLLQKLQDAYNYLPLPVLKWVGRQTGIPDSRIHGVITFYSQFYTTPRGRHTVKCCQGTACHVKGSRRIADQIMKELSVKEGGTTTDGRFTFESVACLGTCFLAPVIMVDDDYFGQLSPSDVSRILKQYT